MTNIKKNVAIASAMKFAGILRTAGAVQKTPRFVGPSSVSAQWGRYASQTIMPPATPPNGCLLRTSYMASHTEALLDEAFDIIRDVLGRFPVEA